MESVERGRGKGPVFPQTLSSFLLKHQKEIGGGISNFHIFHNSGQWPRCSPVAQQRPLLLPNCLSLPTWEAGINPEGKEDTTSLHGQEYSSLQDVTWPPVPLGQ